jgi:hypothetical protein
MVGREGDVGWRDVPHTMLDEKNVLPFGQVKCADCVLRGG